MKKIVIFIATIFLLSISVFAAPTVSVNKYLNNKNLMIKKVPTAIKLSKAEDPAGLGNVYVFNKDGGMSLFLRYNGNKVTVTTRTYDLRRSARMLMPKSLRMQ